MASDVRVPPPGSEEYAADGHAYNALLRQFSDAMQRIGRLESQLASISDSQDERFRKEDFVDSPVGAPEARLATQTNVTQTAQPAKGPQDDVNDQLRRK